MKSEEKVLTIGAVAKAAGVAVETIRFYEREGLLTKPRRRPSGYRVFDESVIDRIRQIKRMSAHFPLKEVRQLMNGKGIAEARKRIQARIQELQEFNRELGKGAAL